MNFWLQIWTFIVAVISAAATVGAAIATYMAAKSARDSANVSAEQLKTQLREQARIERPRLVPLNQQIVLSTKVLRDWTHGTNGVRYAIKGKYPFSKFKIPLINAGKSFAIDIKYCYEIEGGIDAIKSASFNTATIKRAEYIEGYEDEGYFRFDIVELNEQAAKEGRRMDIFHAEMIPYYRYISILHSEEQIEIKIPNYFVALSNLYGIHYLTDEKENVPSPVLRLTIEYTDQYNKPHKDIYRMKLSDKHVSIKGAVVKTWVDFEFIDPNENKPHQ